MGRPTQHAEPKSRITITVRTDWLRFIKSLEDWGFGSPTGDSNVSLVIEELMREPIETLMRGSGERIRSVE